MNALGADAEMHMRIRLMVMQDHHPAVITEFGPGELPRQLR